MNKLLSGEGLGVKLLLASGSTTLHGAKGGVSGNVNLQKKTLTC